jgi:enoyl-CoA hydratase/carnithine racemase
MEIVMKGKGKNSLGTEMMDFLLARLQEAGGRPILLTGDGDAFSAGLNLKEVASLDGAQMEAFLRKIDTLAESLYTYAGPTVALVNGHAIAGGCVLALCCDYQVAVNDPKTRIGLNELALGAVFPPRVLGIVRQRIPNQHANRVLLGAELYSPEEAFRLGLIDDISDSAPEVARRRLAHLAGHPAKTYAATKRALRTLPPDSTIDQQFRIASAQWTSPEVKQKIIDALKR